MDNKIQMLTEQLYNEGVAKGMAKQEEIVKEAQAQAEKIIADAKAEAEAIVEEAKSSALQEQQNSIREITLASRQMTSDVKHHLETMVVAKVVSGDVASAFKDDTFVKELIVEMVKSGAKDYTISVAADKKAEIEKFVASKLSATLPELEIVGDAAIKLGFKVQPKGEGYYISFTDRDFDTLLKSYLRPKVLEILFGEKE